MDADIETEIEMVRRHVLRGETIIGKQHMLIERLRNLSISTVEAERLLDTFQSIQALHLLHLSRISR